MKWLLGALLLANLGLFAWAQGWLGLPAPDQSQREPWRSQRQVQPQAITVLGAAAASAVSPAPNAGPTTEPAEAAQTGPTSAALAPVAASAPSAASAPAPQSPGGGGQSR